MSKALIHELGKSRSYGRLSLLAKVLWPMLLAASDDQGRGQADPDVIKWYVCPNVAEIAQEDIPTLLEEMQTQGMIILYGDPGEQLYQVVNWWEYQKMQWAHPSKYNPPEGWTDKLRYNVRGGGYFEENWKDETSPVNVQEVAHVEQPPGFPPGNPPGLTTKLNLQLNSTQHLTAQEPSPPTAEKAAPPALEKSPLEPDTWQARMMFAKLRANAEAKGRRGPKQFSSLEQKEKFDQAVIRLDGQFKEALSAGLSNGYLSVKALVNYMASPKWQEQQPQKSPRAGQTREVPLDVQVQQAEIRRQLGRSD